MTEPTTTHSLRSGTDAQPVGSSCGDRCRDAEQHAFYVEGGGFDWCWPHFDRMTGAHKVTRLMLNRYPHNVIGVALYMRGHGFGVRWKDSGHPMRGVHYVRSFYETNRQAWPEMNRPKALLSAWRCWRMVKHHA